MLSLYEIGVNLILPRGTKLAASLDKGCIWRQSRGSVVELSMYDGMLLAEKIGMAQQWYDELDSLSFSNPTSSEELGMDDLEHTNEESPDKNLEFGTYIQSVVDVSRGVGEVIIDSVVYLTLDESSPSTGEDPSHSPRILDILDKEKSRKNEELCFSLFSESCNEHHLVFMKHAHVQIRLKCSDDAPTDTPLQVNVVL
eukprot:Gb_18469 [translate_table: standard]